MHLICSTAELGQLHSTPNLTIKMTVDMKQGKGLVSGIELVLRNYINESTVLTVFQFHQY
jgi:hypothetical protein